MAGSVLTYTNVKIDDKQKANDQIDDKKNEFLETSIKKVESTPKSFISYNTSGLFQMQMADTELERIQTKVKEEIASIAGGNTTVEGHSENFESKLVQAVLDFVSYFILILV